MFIKNVKLKNFRCFKNKEFNFDKRLVLIEGGNGSGKTSLLEALYYACYLQSFRTRLSREIVEFDKNQFFFDVGFDSTLDVNNHIQIGYSEKDGKLVKLNKKPVQSYKELLSHYKIISISEDDLQLISRGPDGRRSFLNQSLFLLDSHFVFKSRKYKQTLALRNAFFIKNMHCKLTSTLESELVTWTKQLWQQSLSLQNKRIELLLKLQDLANAYLKEYFPSFKKELQLNYLPKNLDIKKDFDSFWDHFKKTSLSKEIKWGRSLFGAHLDDFSIYLKDKKARFYASRGQQKLILFLLKISQFKLLNEIGENGVLLLDDFLTDFDTQRISEFLNFFQDFKYQVFITCPLDSYFFRSAKKDLQIINLLT